MNAVDNAYDRQIHHRPGIRLPHFDLDRRHRLVVVTHFVEGARYLLALLALRVAEQRPADHGEAGVISHGLEYVLRRGAVPVRDKLEVVLACFEIPVIRCEKPYAVPFLVVGLDLAYLHRYFRIAANGLEIGDIDGIEVVDFRADVVDR